MFVTSRGNLGVFGEVQIKAEEKDLAFIIFSVLELVDNLLHNVRIDGYFFSASVRTG